MGKKAFITGITGQDGSYLTELLLGKGYEVHGMVRRTSTITRSRLNHLFSNPDIYNRTLFLHYADLDDPTTFRRLMNKCSPDEIYHLAGQSHVGLSFEIPESTCEMTAMGTLRLLEIIRDLPKAPRLYHASSSEIFGAPKIAPQDESTPFSPVNPYGCAKAFATQMVKIYRETFGFYAVNGIMYNHESPRRGENFVTRKICRAAAAIKLKQQKELTLGDLDMRRDWGDARDFIQGMWMTLQQEKADDYIFATGVTHAVRDVLNVAFETVGIDWKPLVKTDPRFLMSAESTNLVGNPAKALRIIGWKPQHSFEDLIREITQSELELLQSQ